VDSYAVLTRMAEVLRVEIEELTGPGGGDGEERQRVYEPAMEIERAMMGYEAVSASIGGREPGTKATAAHLRARASASPSYGRRPNSRKLGAAWPSSIPSQAGRGAGSPPTATSATASGLRSRCVPCRPQHSCHKPLLMEPPESAAHPHN